MTHTRSIRRRFFALLIDAVLVAVVFGLLTYPLASSLDSQFRSGLGLFHWRACGPGVVQLQNGAPVKMSDWQQLQICDAVIDGVFPYRSAIFSTTTRTESNGSTSTFTKYISFELDSQNRLTFPMSLSFVGWLLFFALAICLEARWGQTPGKRLMKLYVAQLAGSKLTITQALKRNLLKNFLYIALAILNVGSATFTNAWLQSFVTPDGTIAPFDATMGTAFAIAIPFSIVGLLQLAMWFSVILPWSKAGRGWYDRWSGTEVRRE